MQKIAPLFNPNNFFPVDIEEIRSELIENTLNAIDMIHFIAADPDVIQANNHNKI